jgi:hypothetical protein
MLYCVKVKTHLEAQSLTYLGATVLLLLPGQVEDNFCGLEIFFGPISSFANDQILIMQFTLIKLVPLWVISNG